MSTGFARGSVTRGQWLAAHLPALLAALEHEREFRVHQVVDLAVPGRDHRYSGVDSIILHGARRALDDIDRALAAIRLGTYGRCEVCGGEIPVERLWAVPRTRFCAQCYREPSSTR